MYLYNVNSIEILNVGTKKKSKKRVLSFDKLHKSDGGVGGGG